MAFTEEQFGVSTDKKQYFVGDSVNIRGHVPMKDPPPSVVLQVRHQTHGPIAAYRFDTAVPTPFPGMYSYYFSVGGRQGFTGKYEVQATCEGDQRSATFEVISGSSGASLHAYFLMVDIVGLTKTGSTNDKFER
jgi:hypothetical protein